MPKQPQQPRDRKPGHAAEPIGAQEATALTGGILACFAHPDDETFGSGGTLARCAGEGLRVDLACATRGEVGEISDPALATKETLAQVREQELRCACRELGVHGLHLLGYRDSGMAGTPENDHPQALCNASAKEVVGKLVALIRTLRPVVVLTFDPHGGYGHPDHVAIHHFATESFRAAADPNRFPDHAGTHQAARLYYSAIPRERIRQMMEYAAAAGTPFDLGSIPLEEMGIPEEAITTEVTLSSYAEIKRRAMQCHRTQMGPVSPFASLPPEALQEFLGREFFIRAYPPLEPGPTREAWLLP